MSFHTATRMWRKFGLAVVLLVLGVSPLLAQDSPLAAQVRALNGQLLRIQGQLQQAAPGEVLTLQNQAVPVIDQRAQALTALIAQNPRAALSLAFSQDLLARLAASFPQSAARLETQGTWQGTIDYLVTMDFDLINSISTRKMHVGSEILEINFAGPEPSGLKSGDLLVAQGVRSGNQVAAQSGNILASSSTAGAVCSTIGAQNVVAVMVNFPNYSLASGITPDLVKGILMGNAYAPTSQSTTDWSVDGFWKDNSDGQTWIDPNVSKVVGPFTLSSNYNTDSLGASYCNSDGIRAAAIAAADSSVNFPDYSRLMIVMPPNGACGWAGLGSLGCWSNSAPADGSFTASVSWLRSDQMSTRNSGVKLFTHEGGHNLTLHHASSRDFGAETLGALGTTGTLSEYGDVFSTMGSWNLGFYNAHHASGLLHWLTSNSNFLVVESNGAYQIQNYEARPAGLKALKIRRGTGNNTWLWVEYRKNSGIYDSQLSSQVWNGALIHYEDSQTGTHTHLLDYYQPELNSWSNVALESGSTWTDAYSNVSLSVLKDTINPSLLNVTVTYGPLTCTLANPTVTLSPPNPSVEAGKSVTYTVSVQNNDSAGCASSTFNLASTQPSLWTASLSATSLTIAPGSTSSTTILTESPPAGTLGTYTISVTATNSAYPAYNSTSVGNSCTVTEPPPPLTVSIISPISGATIPARTTVTMTATVFSSTSPVSGASVKFTMTKSDGKVTTKTVTTITNGTATWSYKLLPKDPTGTTPYKVTAQATYGSQSGSSSAVSFTVQ